jgi:hypothetical protein
MAVGMQRTGSPEGEAVQRGTGKPQQARQWEQEGCGRLKKAPSEIGVGQGNDMHYTYSLSGICQKSFAKAREPTRGSASEVLPSPGIARIFTKGALCGFCQVQAFEGICQGGRVLPSQGLARGFAKGFCQAVREIAAGRPICFRQVTITNRLSTPLELVDIRCLPPRPYTFGLLDDASVAFNIRPQLKPRRSQSTTIEPGRSYTVTVCLDCSDGPHRSCAPFSALLQGNASQCAWAERERERGGGERGRCSTLGCLVLEITQSESQSVRATGFAMHQGESRAEADGDDAGRRSGF